MDPYVSHLISSNNNWNYANLFLPFFALILALFYAYCTNNNSYWKKRGIVFIKPDFFYGNVKDYVAAKTSLPELLDRFYHEFKSKGSDFGGCFQFKQPFFLVCSPALVKDITVKNFPVFHDRSYPIDAEADPLSSNLFFTGGKKWKFLRAKLTPTFTTGKMKAMMPLIKEVAEYFQQVLEKASNSEEDTDIREMCAQYTTDIIGSCAFGLQFNTLRDSDSEFRKIGRKVFTRRKFEELIRLFRDLYPTIATRIFKFRIFNEEVTNFFIRTMKATIRQRSELDIRRNDFVQLLMEMRNTKVTSVRSLDGEKLSGIANFDDSVEENVIELTDEVLAAQSAIFFLAGFETSATTMSFCLYELAQQVSIQEKLAEEARRILEKYGEFTYEALQELTYMDQVLNETLRKYPAGSKVTRKCCEPYQIPGTDSYLEPGMMVVIPIWSFHHDPDLFPEPDRFDPERFSPENKAKIEPYSFMPFGAGPRICIGMRFAMLEMKLALASTITKYRVHPCSSTKPIRINPGSFVLAPIDGIRLKVEKR